MDALPLMIPSSGRQLCLAAVGSGGKTSCLTFLARQYRAAGYSVFLTTTTHMRRTSAAFCSPHLAELQTRLASSGFLFSGTPVPGDKLGPLPPEHMQALAQQAQITLIEGDGSRGLPLKLPAAWEPVLPAHPDLVYVVAGLSALGHPLEQVCHRWELAVQALHCSPHHLVTPQLCAALLELGYVRPLQEAQHTVSILLNQADTATAEQIQAVKAALSTPSVFALSLRQALTALAPVQNGG